MDGRCLFILWLHSSDMCLQYLGAWPVMPIFSLEIGCYGKYSFDFDPSNLFQPNKTHRRGTDLASFQPGTCFQLACRRIDYSVTVQLEWSSQEGYQARSFAVLGWVWFDAGLLAPLARGGLLAHPLGRDLNPRHVSSSNDVARVTAVHSRPA